MKSNSWELSKGTVTDEQVDQFIKRMRKLIRKEAEAEFGHDDHNLIPITICLINKIKYQNLHPLLVEHRHLVETSFERMERFFSVVLNMSEAFHNLEIEAKIMRSKELQKRDKDKNG